VGLWFGIKGRYPQEFKLEQGNDDFYSAIKENQTIQSKVLQIHFLDCNDLRKEIFFQWKSSAVMNPKVLANVEISLQSHRYVL